MHKQNMEKLSCVWEELSTELKTKRAPLADQTEHALRTVDRTGVTSPPSGPLSGPLSGPTTPAGRWVGGPVGRPTRPDQLTVRVHRRVIA
jgi:hypothetical protein